MNRTSLRFAVESLRRPYQVTPAMVIFVAIVPLYIFIAEFLRGRPLHTLHTRFDRALPLQPVWALVYGALYLFLILLPVFVVRDRRLIRRTIFAYLFVWLVAYGVFVLFPTVAPRPSFSSTDSLAAWGLRFLYSADPPLNCFPSLHVAHSFVSAFACRRVHRRVGTLAIVCAVLVGISTLLTKQHYAVDVVAGLALALLARALFLPPVSHLDIPEVDQQAAPVFAAAILSALVVAVAFLWVAYALFVRLGAG